MKNLLITIGIIFALCKSTFAGGDSFLIEIVSLTPKENGEYRMEFLQHTAPYAKALQGSPKRVVVNLRYNEGCHAENGMHPAGWISHSHSGR